ncbi:MAG: hypothetical protein ACXACC_01205 [Promethearchaeota archaeon]|jgi:hypothetical protein
MAISFFFNWDWIFSVWGWLFFILPVVAFIFLIIGCSDLKKDERNFESVNFLNIIGIILLAWSIGSQFLPSIMYSYSMPEYYIGLSYVVSLAILSHAVYIIFGVALIIFGSKNKEHWGSLNLSAGILLTISWGLSLTYNIGFGTLLIVRWIIQILSVVGVILILVNTILIKKVFMIIFAAFLLSYGILNLLNLANLI